jgi:hypothetical protein
MIKSTWENKAKNDAGVFLKHPKVKAVGSLLCGNHNYVATDKDKLGLEVILIRFICTVAHEYRSENNATVVQ